MATPTRTPRINLRQGLDRDVYAILKKLEDANDGKPFKNISAVYDAIKRSNSSLSRQKKRPLEDSIDRVLRFRKDELADSSDSEAALEELPTNPADDRFLLNKQMTKHWNVESNSRKSAPPEPSSEPRATKKRRVQEDGGERNGTDVTTPKGALTDGQADIDAATVEKSSKEKTLTKKTQKPSRLEVEIPTESLQVGGLSDAYRDLLDEIRVFKQPGLSVVNGWRNVPGILLSGPTGTGKKSLIRSVAAHLELPIVHLDKCFWETERMERSLNDAVEEAMRLAPCIILINKIDLYMPKPGSNGTSDSHRNQLQFLKQMERIKRDQDSERPIVAMATTANPTNIDSMVLIEGCFERTIHLKVPDLYARQEIWKMVTRHMNSFAEDIDFRELAKITHGFVGADIVVVMTVAQNIARKRFMVNQDSTTQLEGPRNPIMDVMDIVNDDQLPLATVPSEPIIPVTQQDFKTAIKGFVPSLRKEGFSAIPNVTWAQVGALAEAREQLELSIIGPISDPNLYRSAGLKRPAGCLLWGPPGCGKTLVAQAVANEAQASFILIKGPELLNKYVGESERAVRELFNRARASSPCILFFDEMDSLVPRRDNTSTEAGARVVNALLAELDGVQERAGVYVIGTTNRPDMIDPAMLRPGRLSVRLFLDLPTADERVEILSVIYRSNHPTATAAEIGRLEAVARDERCDDFSGADLDGLHVKAAENAIRRWRKQDNRDQQLEINEVDWERALATSHRSVSNPETYRKLEAKLGKST